MSLFSQIGKNLTQAATLGMGNDKPTSTGPRLGQTSADGEGQAAPDHPDYAGTGGVPGAPAQQIITMPDGSTYAFTASGRYANLQTGAYVTDPSQIQTLEARRAPGASATPGTNQANALTSGEMGLPGQPGGPAAAPGPAPTGYSSGRQTTGGQNLGYGTPPDEGQRAALMGEQPGQQPGMTSTFQDYLTRAGLAMPTVVDDFARYLGPAEAVFRQELDRLAQNDPFGNQAFLQKATDRAVGQASAVAAGARGGAGAVGGALRQAQGVQSQLAAQGVQEMAEQKAQDARQAEALKMQAAGGLAGLAQTGAQLQVENQKNKIAAFDANVKALTSLEGLSLDERKFAESANEWWAGLNETAKTRIANTSLDALKIDEQRYQTDLDYQAKTDATMAQVYGIDKDFAAKMKQIAQQGKLTFKDVFTGILGAGGNVAAGFATKSDRRAKYQVKDPDYEEIKDFLAKSRGFSYKYKDSKDGKGTNYGPMAQGLKASKMGRASVVTKADGLYVDTARLALTDHMVIVQLHDMIQDLKKEIG